MSDLPPGFRIETLPLPQSRPASGLPEGSWSVVPPTAAPVLPPEPPRAPTIGEAFRNTISGLGQTIGASLQGTSPTVQQIGGKMNYPPALGEPGPMDSGGIGWIDASGGHKVDPSKHVILNDPQTGKAMVYPRPPGESTLGSNLTALGRLLGFGMMAPSGIASPSTGGSVTRAIANQFGSPETRAQSHIGSAMRSDTAASGPGPLQIFDELTAAKAPQLVPGPAGPQTVIGPSGAPMTVLDVAGENVRGLGGQVARMPGPGRQNIVKTLGDRDVQSGTRLAQSVNEMGAEGQGTFLAGRSLEAQAKATAGPLYGRAEMAPPINPDLMAQGGELATLMNRPSMKDAAKNAVRIAAEEGRDPASLGITFNQAGEPVFAKTPSWTTLDYIKRGLDDVIDTYRDKTTGRVVLDTQGRAVDQTRRVYLELLDRHNPDYAAARAAWSGPQQSRGALKQGSLAFNKGPDEIAAELAELSPSDQQFYRLGAANALKTQLAKTSSGGNEARALIGNDYRQEQLRRIFPNAEQLLEQARNESTMFGTKFDVLGGSQTAPRLAQDAGREAGGVLRPLAEAATAAVTHEPVLAAKSAFSALQALMKNGKITPETGDMIAKYLLSGDPQTAKAWMMEAFNRTGPVTSRIRPKVPIIGMTAQELSLLPQEERRR